MPEEQDRTEASATDSIQSIADTDLPARYKSKGIIGKGGMGVVYRAHDLQLGRDVAVKMLLFEGSKNDPTQERFKREAKVLAALDHPNVVRILAWGINDSGNPYQVMDFLEGKALSKVIGNGQRLTPEKFYTVFSQVLSGLSEAHKSKIVHRDIKPSNIILCEAEQGLCPKIIDFGIARINDQGNKGAETITQEGSVLGSPSYMSPEQCKGEKVDYLSDVYSIACVMYEAITGYPPQRGETSIEVMYKHMSTEAAKLEKLASDSNCKQLGRMIDECLNKDPAKRAQSADNMLTELKEIFSSKISGNRNMFASNAPVKMNKTVIVYSAGLICAGVIAVLFFCHPTPFSNRKANKFEQVFDIHESAVSTIQKRFESARGVKEKTRLATQLAENLLVLAKSKHNLKDDESAEAAAMRALALCPIFEGETHDLKASILLNLAYFNMGLKRMKAAEKNIDEALNCRLSDEHKSIEVRPTLAKERAKLKIVRHDFKGAKEDVKLLIDESYFHNQTEKNFTRRVGAEVQDSSVPMVHELSAFLSKQKMAEDRELTDVLDLHNSMLSHLLEYRDYDVQNSVNKITEILNRISMADKRARETAVQTYNLLSQFARVNSNLDLAEKYKQRSIELKAFK